MIDFTWHSTAWNVYINRLHRISWNVILVGAHRHGFLQYSIVPIRNTSLSPFSGENLKYCKVPYRRPYPIRSAPSFSVVKYWNDYMFIWLISSQDWLKSPKKWFFSSLLCPYKLYLPTVSSSIRNDERILLWMAQSPSRGCAFAPCACIRHYTVCVWAVKVV